MVRKLNCWEFHNCGREHGGLLAEALGVCPVSTAMKHDGVHDGIAAGRICWMVRHSFYRVNQSEPGCSSSCHTCEFYLRVLYEEAENTRCRFASAAV